MRDGIAAIGEIVAVGRQHAHTAPDQRQDAKLLRHQLAGEAAGILDDDDANAVALDAVKQLGEAGARINRIGTRHGGIVELGDQVEACTLGEALDGGTLALVGACTSECNDSPP